MMNAMGLIPASSPARTFLEISIHPYHPHWPLWLLPILPHKLFTRDQRELLKAKPSVLFPTLAYLVSLLQAMHLFYLWTIRSS